MSTKNKEIVHIQFILSIMVVFIHSTTLFMNLPNKELEYIYGENFSTFIQIFLADGVCRIAVPIFMMISGFLFYNTFDGSFHQYLYKMRRRLFSLVLPYLFWSSIVFIAFSLAQQIPILESYFTTRRLNEEYIIKSIFENVVIESHNSPLWYFRYLIVFSIFSPLWYFLGKNFPVILLITTFLGWLGCFNHLSFLYGIRLDTLFFYGLGTTLAIWRDKISSEIYEKKLSRNILIVSILAWGIILIFRTLYYCKQNPQMMLNGTYDSIVIYTGIAGIIFGILSTASFTCQLPILNIKTNYNFKKYCEYSFLIFVCHHPLVNTIKKLSFKLVQLNSWTALLIFFVTPVVSILIIIFTGILLKRKLPIFYNFIVGNR